MGGEGGGLRRPVGGADHQVRAGPLQGADGVRGDDVAAGGDLPQPGEDVGCLLGEDPEETGGRVEVGGPVGGDEPSDVCGGGGPGRRHDHASAAQQGHPEFVRRGVEGVVGVEDHALGDGVAPAPVEREGGHARVGDRHALGPSGRPGGEHHVRQSVPRHVGAEIGRRPGPRPRTDLDHGQVPRHVPVSLRRGVDEEQARRRVVEDLPGPLPGVAVVQRHIARAGLQGREDRHHEVRRALHEHPHEIAGPDAPRDEEPGQPVRPFVHLCVGEGLFGVDQRRVRGVERGPALEEPREALRRRGRVRAGVAPRVEQSALLPEEHVEVGHGLVGGAGEGVQAGGEAVAMQGEFRLVVHGGVGFEFDEHATTAVLRTDGDDRQVLDRTRHDLVAGDAQAGEGRFLLEGDGVDGHRVQVVRDAQQAQFRAEFLAPVALVPDRVADASAGLGDELGERRRGAEGEAQRQHVHRHGRGGRGRPSHAGGQRQSDDHLARAVEPVQIRGGRGDDEQRPAARGARHRLQEPAHPLPGQPYGAAQHGCRGRGGASGEGDGGGWLTELAQPVGAVARVARGEAVLRVLGEEAVQGGEGPGAGVAAGRQGAVEVREAAQVEVLAVAVEDDVVVAQVQPGPVVGQPEQGVRGQRTAPGVHGGGQVAVGPGTGGGFRAGGFRAQVDDGQRVLGEVRDAQAQFVLVHDEPRPQALRFRERPPHGRTQRRDVEVTFEDEADTAGVQRAVGVQLVGQPDALVCGARGPVRVRV